LSYECLKRRGSDSHIHVTAGIFGEADAFLSMTALRAAAEGGREAIID
jgi:hypothetical protein